MTTCGTTAGRRCRSKAIAIRTNTRDTSVSETSWQKVLSQASARGRQQCPALFGSGRKTARPTGFEPVASAFGAATNPRCPHSRRQPALQLPFPGADRIQRETVAAGRPAAEILLAAMPGAAGPEDPENRGRGLAARTDRAGERPRCSCCRRRARSFRAGEPAASPPIPARGGGLP